MYFTAGNSYVHNAECNMSHYTCKNRRQKPSTASENCRKTCRGWNRKIHSRNPCRRTHTYKKNLSWKTDAASIKLDTLHSSDFSDRPMIFLLSWHNAMIPYKSFLTISILKNYEIHHIYSKKSKRTATTFALNSTTEKVDSVNFQRSIR